MRKLSWYILREHFGPFVFAFITITFLLVIEYVPKIVDQVIDKDLSIWIALELVGLNLAWMLALSVPMSVLVATLMAFGRLGSDFEIIAMKASGINLVVAMLPLFAAGALVTYGMVQFNDKVLPDLNKKARLLTSDIRNVKPTIAFRSGVFIDDIPGYQILVDNINHSTSEIKGVWINDKRDANKPRLITADHGILKVIQKGKYLHFTLFDGQIHSFDMLEPQNYRKVDFNRQEIQIEGRASELVRTDSEHRTDRDMSIDSLQSRVDQAWGAIIPLQSKIYESYEQKLNYLLADTFKTELASVTSDSVALVRIEGEVAGWQRLVNGNWQQIKAQKAIMDRFSLEVYKKYSIPAASLAFILIGAPLGILAKRGGMGMAIAYSLILFIIYWAFLIGGEDVADRGIVSPFWAMWSANILLAVIGIYLLYLVMTEKPIFSYFRQVK
jgi:lipopolysaccharide export system permease protein